jgi:hypothetical protein
LVAGIVALWVRSQAAVRGRHRNVDERIRRAAALILDDASLTGDMNDAEGSRLIDWAVAASRKVAEGTAAMDESQAAEALDAQIQSLRRLVRRINKLIGSMGSQPSPEEISEALEKIIESATTVPGVALNADALRSAMMGAQTLPPGEVLDRVLSQLSGDMTNGKA